MRWMVVATFVVTSCSYYGSHKLLRLGDEPEQYGHYETELRHLEEDIRGRPHEFNYSQGPGAIVMASISENMSHVPETVSISASGQNGQVGDVTVIARYTAGPERPDNAHSDVLAFERTLKWVELDSKELFVFRGLGQRQPRRPVEIQVWFKIVAHFRDSSDSVHVAAWLDGSSAGSYKLDYDGAFKKKRD